MLEVVFNNSVKNAMKMAKSYKKENMLGGTVGYSGTAPSKAELEKMFEGEAIEGSPQDVVCLDFHLDIGDISGEIDNGKRKALVFDIFRNHFDKSNNDLIELEKSWHIKLDDLQRLKIHAENGGDIRIWWSNSPNEACGFYFVNTILCNYDCKVSGIKLPRFKVQSDNSVASYSSWNEIMAGKFYDFLPFETKIDKALRNTIAIEWQEQKSQNTSLRAVVNGKLIGVADNFYDHLIRTNIPVKEFKLAQLVGKIMVKNQIGVIDWWYVQRIEKMIENKELKIVSDNEFYYEKVLIKI